MQFSRNNCKPMVYVSSNHLHDFSTNMELLLVTEIISCCYIMWSKIFFTLFLDNFDYLRFRNYPNGDKGI